MSAISKQFTVPNKLALMSGYIGELIPDNTDGSAEASIIISKCSNWFKSSWLRISPCINTTPASFNRGRFSSEPLRLRLSKAYTV